MLTVRFSSREKDKVRPANRSDELGFYSICLGWSLVVKLFKTSLFFLSWLIIRDSKRRKKTISVSAHEGGATLAG